MQKGKPTNAPESAGEETPLPCPFCGCDGSADVMHDEWPVDGDAWFARCSTPGCIQINEVFVSRRAAIAAWNTRSDASTIATMRKALPTWIPVEERLPDNNVPVIAFAVRVRDDGTRWTRRIRAQYAAPNTLELASDCDDDLATYDEATDTYYVAEGWYEDNEYEETHWRVSDTVTHWMNLPEPPK